MLFEPLIAAASLVIAGPSIAPVDNAVILMNDMIRCRTVADDAGRLACFDRLVASIDAAQTKGDLVVLDRKTVIARKQSRFGLPAAKTDVFGGGPVDRATTFIQLDTTIRAATPSGSIGRWNLELADGSVWQTVDAPSFPPKVGTTVVVRQASLGGYRATIARQRSILVKRLR